MNYTEFKDYAIQHLWKRGDTEVIAALDTIVLTAESELNRIFKVEDRVTTADLPSAGETTTLPADCREVRVLLSDIYGELTYIVPADFASKKAAHKLSNKQYTVTNKTIHTLNKVDDVFECWYYRNLIPFASIVDPDTNWIVDDYFDVYLYCVLKHTAPFLREDERLQTWGALFNSAFETAIQENAERKYVGSPLKMKFGKGVR